MRCPADGNLQNATALESMLRARAVPATRDLIILILGWTNGGAQITMREAGVQFIEQTVASLRRFGLDNHYLVVTPLLPIHLRAGSSNLCKNILRARGICCG